MSYQVDPLFEMKWTNPTAAPGISNLMSTWTGYITVPTTGTYKFAASLNSDEDVDVKVGATTVRACEPQRHCPYYHPGNGRVW